jgi:hypothetical protein
MDNDGSTNDKANAALSFFAKTALNNFTIDAIDPQMLVDHNIKAQVVHTVSPNKNDPTKNVTFANLGRDKWAAGGFDTTPVAKALTLGKEANAPVANTVAEAPAANGATPTTGLDLNAILNG